MNALPETGATPAGRRHPAHDEGLHQTFARAARSRPGARALVSTGRTMTYGELDATADVWAARLAAAGVGAGDLVPVLMPRGVEVVVALLAVLKTGAAYALLDPAWPDRRLREVTGQLAAPLLVAGADQADRTGLPLWSPPSGPVADPQGFEPAVATGADPCSVFFTSGTTGRPKGVLTQHRATARLFPPDGFARFRADTVVALAAPVPWDIFSLELWSALLNGGTAAVVEEPYLSPQALRLAVSRHGTDTAWLTTSLFNMVVDEDLDAFTGMRQVMVGGERLSVHHVARFLRRHPEVTLLNGYGPVENTVFATTHRITLADCEAPGGIPLGTAVPGTRVYLLNGSRPCAVGETGEVCVAGDGLAMRYLGDPALTERAFVRLPLDGRSRRVYRTGDLGTWGSDGLLRYLGRADRQLKIRGHRVEPAEVERQVEELLPAVRSCRVLARRDEAGVPQELIAFCVPVRRGDPLTDAVPRLDSELVSYQRPSTVVSVDAFPLTPTGKLDERALLALLPQRPEPAGEGAEPDGTAAGDRTDRLVADTFRAVLGRRSVPPDVSFFALGGGSLDAGRVCARLSALLGHPVPVSRLYQNPTALTLARWSRAVESGLGPDGGTPAGAADLPPDEAPPDELPLDEAPMDDVPLTPMQVMYLTRYLTDPSDRTGRCRLVWIIDGEPDPAALEAAIASVHERHEPLRAAYEADPVPAALLLDIPAPVLENAPEQPCVEAALTVLDEELRTGLSPTDGEVWRTILVPVAGERGRRAVFACEVHHVAFDGWSESVLAADLTAGYRAALEGGADGDHPVPARTPAPPGMAAVHADRMLRLAHADPAASRDLLVRELTGVPALRWPAGPVEAAPAEPRRLEVTLPPEAVAAVDAQAAAAGLTRFAVLLTRCGRALARVTGQDDFAVGIPVAQRESARLEHAIGCHLTMACVRLRGPALAEGAEAVRATGRLVERAFAAQDAPIGEVLRLAGRPTDRRPPLYQALFALQDTLPPRLEFPGLRTTFVREPYRDLPLEFHAEVWPGEDGGLRLVVSYRPDIVPDSAAREFARLFDPPSSPV